MITVVADTNIYVSAFQFGGLPRDLLNTARRHGNLLQIAISPALFDELQGVLRDRFGWSNAMLEAEKGRLVRFLRQVTPTQELDVVKGDRDDNRVLECAVAAGAQFIVTGDKHLLRLEAYQRIRIVTVAEFLRMYPAP